MRCSVPRITAGWSISKSVIIQSSWGARAVIGALADSLLAIIFFLLSVDICHGSLYRHAARIS